MAPSNFEVHQITSRHGLGLYLRDYGPQQAPVVLCLGGLTRNCKDFESLADSLAPDYRVITPDYRGRGMSDYDPDTRNYVPPVYLDDVRNIATALNIHEFVAVGTSLGGLLAMGLAVAMPASLKGVLLNDVAPALPMEALGAVLNYVNARPEFATWEEAKDFMVNKTGIVPFSGEADVDQMVRNTFTQRADGKLVFDWDENIAANISVEDGMDSDLWRMFGALSSIPVLSVRGEKSPFVPQEVWSRMLDCNPRMGRVTVPNTGHAPKLTEPVCRVPILEWLNASFA